MKNCVLVLVAVRGCCFFSFQMCVTRSPERGDHELLPLILSITLLIRSVELDENEKHGSEGPRRGR